MASAKILFCRVPFTNEIKMMSKFLTVKFRPIFGFGNFTKSQNVLLKINIGLEIMPENDSGEGHSKSKPTV